MLFQSKPILWKQEMIGCCKNVDGKMEIELLRVWKAEVHTDADVGKYSRFPYEREYVCM